MKTTSTITILALFTATQIAAAQINKPPRPGEGGPRQKQYTIEQACSDRAQLHTISFNGLAFMTGNFGADCFFPPGKVADFFGFQFMRDNDSNQLGHNTNFLTRIATNTMGILNKGQMQQLITLAQQQESLYDDFAKKRMVLIKAFRDNMESNGKKKLNKQAVIEYAAELYAIDAELSYGRAQVMGNIIRSLSTEQKAAFNKLSFGNSATWPEMPEKKDWQGLSHRAHVGVMTYASELFSWYKGSLIADTYFCPERHGTYFGGFYLKDYPAMHNPGYFISTALTGNAGKSFLDILNETQRADMQNLLTLQKPNLAEIVRLRTSISNALRGFMKGDKVDKNSVFDQIKNYGRQDGEMSYYYATAFANIYKTLTKQQMADLKKLRNLDVLPTGTYIYSDSMQNVPQIDVSKFFI